MLKRWYVRYAIGFLLSLLLAAIFGANVLANSTTAGSVDIHAVTQDDLTGDGSPDRTIILCSFATSEDRVEVYDGAGDMPWSDEWQVATDFDNDTWLFDAGNDGSVNLIIAFSAHGGQKKAYLYDDRNCDTEVSYRVTNSHIRITESRFWTASVTSEPEWWRVDGSGSATVRIAVDADVTVFDIQQFYADLILNDGQPDFDVEIVNVNMDSVLDYELRRVLLGPPEWWTTARALIRVNRHGIPRPYLKGYIFWPLLGDVKSLTREYQYYDTPLPLLLMDWERSRLKRIAGPFWYYPHESGWNIYSAQRIQKDTLNSPNFENPFAYYDLAADKDGWPELVVRSEYADAHDAVFLEGRFGEPIQMMRYSWDQDNDNTWDYSLCLVGRHPQTDVVPFPDFSVHTVQYERYPGWVMERTWDTAVLVESEGIDYYSSEGIYEGFVRSWRDLYVTGIMDSPDLSDLANIRQGLRQEYAPWFNQRVSLYFSPIDDRLHLRNAIVGFFNPDDVHLIRYADLDGDGYFDQWMFTIRPQPEASTGEESDQATIATEQVAETLLKSLQVNSGYLLCGDVALVKLTKSSVPLSLFEALPPRNHEEWVALGEQLERYRKDFTPDDFMGMMDQFQGPTTEIEGASLEDFRLSDGGFRFVLNLSPGFCVLADENGLGIVDLPVGSYLVRYDGTFQVHPLTPPHIVLGEGGLTCDPPTPQQMDWVTIRAVLRNTGLRDCRSLPVRLYAVPEGGKPMLLAEEQVSVPGEGEYAWVQSWPVTKHGHWTIWVEADSTEAVPDETKLEHMPRLELEVVPAPMPQMFAPRDAYDDVRFTWPVALLLGSAGLAAIVMLGLIWSAGTKGEQEDSHQRIWNE